VQAPTPSLALQRLQLLLGHNLTGWNRLSLHQVLDANALLAALPPFQVPAVLEETP
jgi:hypothetical protein